MTDISTSQHTKASFVDAKTVLDGTVKSWIAIALVGQWFFAFYILFLYLTPLLSDVSISGIVMSRGYDELTGIDLGIFFSHILPAAIMALSGLIQFVPSIRRSYPTFHRWNGRMIFVLGLSGAATGLYMTWFAGLRGSDVGAMGITINGILIPIAIGLAWYFAIKKRYQQHMRWAIHSFLLINGVWTFRLYLFGWYMINQGPNGNNATLDGPADLAISYACYLLPMAIAELVFWAKKQNSNMRVWVATGASMIGVLLTLIGIIASGMMMWLPPIFNLMERISA